MIFEGFSHPIGAWCFGCQVGFSILRDVGLEAVPFHIGNNFSIEFQKIQQQICLETSKMNLYYVISINLIKFAWLMILWMISCCFFVDVIKIHHQNLHFLLSQPSPHRTLGGAAGAPLGTSVVFRCTWRRRQRAAPGGQTVAVSVAQRMDGKAWKVSWMFDLNTFLLNDSCRNWNPLTIWFEAWLKVLGFVSR